MNKIFKVIWSKSKQCYIVVSEIAKNKTGKKKIVVASILAALAMASSVQDVSAVTGSGGTNNFSNAGSGVSFKQGEGLAIGTNATVASGNTNTVAIGVASVANGSSSFAASGGSTASGKDGQIAIGWSSTNGKGAVAIGGTSDTASGRDTRATGTSAVALGVGSAANGSNAFVASGGSATGNNAIAISGGTADGNGSIAIGWQTNAKNDATAVGSNAQATDKDSVAVGKNSNAAGESATAVGSSATASGRGGVAVGWNAESAVNAVGVGFNAKAKANNTVAIGVEANNDNAIDKNYSSVSIGVKTRARAVGSMAMGVSADASGKYSIALGSGDVVNDYTNGTNYPKATGEKAIAIGYNSNASDANAIAIGSNTLAKDAESIAVGTSNTTAYRGGVALGRNAKAENTAINNVAIGIDVTAGANTNGTADGEAVAVGRNAKANSFRTVAIGSDVSATGSTAVAMGRSANVSNNYGVAVGARVEAGNYGVALGYQAKSTASGALAIGAGNDDTKVMATATTASGGNSVAIGTSAKASIANAVALGSDSTTATNATNQSSATINSITYNFAGATSDTGMQVSVGAAGKERQIKNVAAGEVSATSTDAINGSQLFAVASQIKPVNYFSVKSTAAGNKNNDGATGVNAIAIGPDATATSAQSIALGKSASASGTDSIAIGNGSTAANKVAPVAIGQGAKANGDFSVALGGGNHQFVGAIANGVGSTALGTTSNTADGQNYQTVVGFGANTNKAEATAIGYKATVTVEGGVALGANSSSSTGRTVGYNPNDGRTNTYSALTGNVIRSTTGAIAVGNGSTVTRQITGVAAGTNDTDAVNVAQLKSVNLAFKGNVGSGDVNLATNDSDKKLTIQGDRTYITTNASGNTLTISANKKDINVTNGTARADAGVADAKNVAEAINNAVSQNKYKWYLTADNDTGGSRSTIDKEGTVKFSGDSNITVSRNGNTITTSLNKAITVDSVKANKTITVGTNKITLDGNTGAVTGKAFTGDSFTAGDNVLSNTTLQIGSPTGANNVSITRDGLTAKAGTKTVKFGTNGIDAGGQKITNVSSGGNVGTNAANITDVKNAVSDVTLKLDTNAKTGNVKLGESPLKVIGANGIRTDLVGTNNGSLVVGLDSNTVNATTKGIGLTGDTGSTGLKYLKDGDASFKVAGDGNLVTTKASATGVQVAVDIAKVKDLAVDAVTVSKANTVDNPITVTPKAGTNSKEYAIGIDTTKLAAKTHLAYTANGGTAKTVSLAKGLNFVNGTNTMSSVDSDGKVSFDLNQATKDSINKSATAVGRTITLNADSGTGSSQSLSNGNVSFAVSGATGDYISTTMDGSAVKVSTKRATINSDANTGAASVTGADGLATAKNVASAINSAVNGLSQNLNISDGTNNSSVALKNQKLTVTGTGAAKATVNGQTITIDVAKGTLTANANGTATGTAGVADASDVASAINNTNTVLGNKITKNAQDIATNTSNITANKNQIITNTTNIATNTTNIAHTIALADDKGTSTTAKSLKDGNVSFNIKGDNQFISTAASGNDVTLTVNEQAIKDAAKSASSFKVKANTHAEEEVKGGDTIAFNNGDNIEISQTGKTFTIGTAKNITVDSVTAGNTVINTSGLTNGTTAITGTGITTDKVTVGGISIDKTAGINAGNKVISNVDSGGTTLTNAANIGDVQNAVANLSQNLNITDGANNGTVNLKNQKLNVAGANGVTATVNNQTITVGLDADTVNATTKGIGLTADTGSTGNKYLKDGDVSFAVTGDGSLVSTSATAAGVKVVVKSASITAGTDGTITGPTTDGVATAKNVVDAINVAKKASKTEITANTGEAANATTGNVTLTSTTAADGHTIYDVKLNDKVTLGSGANAVTIDGTTGAITGKTATIGGVTVNGTANTIGGLSNTTWNGTAVSGRAATEDQLKAATGATTLKFTGDVAANTGSVNLKDDTFGIKGDNKYISTDVNGKNVNLTVSEAEVKKSAVAAVTVSTDTTDANNPLTVTPTTSADGTTKDYKVTIDGTKIANKTNLSYKANGGTAKQVSLADGLNFKNGTLTTASIDDNGVVKYDVNTAAITAGADGTITGPTTDGVATAQNVADAINAAKKASKTEITANTGEAANATTGNVTLTSTTVADGHTIYDVKLNDKVTLGSGTNAVTVDGTTGAITGKTATIGGVTVNGTANTIGGLSNTTWNGTATTGRAATEDQLKAVADAASSQTWNITADKAGTTGNQTGTKKNATVGKDETVELVAGDNLTINQDERKFTYSLNKDLAGLTSVSIGTGTTETIKLDGATGKITAKNAAIGGVTIDGDNKHVTGLSNTTWNGTATTGRAATEDQLKAVAETAKTTTDAVNLKFTGDTNTSPGVVNLKDDTLGIVGDGKYVSTDANGKNLTVKVSEAEVKKSAVAAVTVSTDTTDANNPLTVTPTTSADGTTKDYKVTIDGTKIANKTNLSYKANDGTPKQVSLADGLNFKNGTLTTASIDDNGVVKYDVNTATITAGADGTITSPTTDGVATAQNVADAINAAKKASKTEITANTGETANATTGNVTLTSTTAADGHTIYDVKLNDKVTLGSGANAVTIDGTAGKATIGSSVINGVNNTFTTGGAKAVTLDGATGTITGTTANIGGVTVNGTANTIGGLSNTTWNGTATTGRAATEDQLKAVADAAGSQTWEITADKDAATSGAQTGTKKNAKVGKDDKVQLIAGENLTVNQNERDFTYSLNKDLVKMNSATFEATGGKTTVIKGDSIVQTDGANVNTSNATSNTITDGTNTSAITAGKGQIGSVGIDGIVSKITTGGANAVVINGADGTIKTGTVTVTGGTTNDITGLSNTTVTAADFATKGRAATEEQLKAATGATTLKFTGDVATNTGSVNLKDDTFGIKGDNKYISTDVNGKNVNLTVSEAEVKKSAVAAVTVSTDTTDTNNPLTVTPTTSADGTTKDYKVTIDGTKIANKTNLSYKANDGTAKQVSLADGLNFKNGTLTTASIDDNGVVKYDVNTASITAGTDGTITGPTTDGVATAQNVADAINAAKKASKTEITANTGEAANATTGNVTLTSTTAADGHTIYDVKLNDKVTLGSGANAVTIDGTAGKATIGSSIVDGVNSTFTTGGANAVKLDGAAGTIKTGTVTVTGGTTNDITGLSNTTVTSADFATKGRAATEEQLKAVGEQTWQITADKDATTSGAQTGTKKNAKVGKDDKVQLIAGENLTVNQNERDFTYSLNKDLVKMNSATFEATGGRTTVIKGDSIVQTDGTKVNTSTAGGSTVADGTKSTETTADGQVIKDGAKSNKSTVDSNVIDDGNGNVNTSNATSNTITDGTNTSTVTAGKAQIGTVGIDGVASKITTGGANAVVINGADGTVKTGTVTVIGGTTNDITGLSNTTVTAADFATKGRAATEEQLKAVGEQTWQITADKDATTSGAQTGTKKDAKVGKNDKVQLIAGENMTVNQNERDFTYSLNKDLVKMNSATFEATGGKTTVIKGDSIVQTDGTKVNTSTAAGNTVVDGAKSTATTADGTTVTTANGNTNYAADGVRINTTGKTPVSLTDAGLDNGNNVIKNVASGHVNNDATDNTNAANIADVKKATTTVTANAGEAANATTGNVTLTSTTAADGHTIYDVKLNDKVTLGSGANAVTIDGTAGKATFGSSVVDGVNNTFTTGGANAVKLDGAAGTIKTGTVTVTGGTTNDITGLSNTTVTAADFATKGRAATEEQLKAVGEQTWQITADKDATTSGAQTGTKKDAKVGKNDKVQLIAGENMTVNQNERDFTFTLNKDLVKMNSATFEATGGKTIVIKGDSIVQTDGTKVNTSTAGGNTVADGTKSTETTADGQVIKDGTKTNTSTVDENTLVDGAKSNKATVDSNVVDDGNGNVNTSNATSNTITDGTNRSTITAGKATIGSSVIDGVNNTFTTGGANAVKLDGAAGTIKTGTVTVTGGTTNDITGLSNTTVTAADFATKGRAATEEQLKAVGEQTWQITADKDVTTSGAQTGTKKDAKVGKDDKVQLIAGENMTVNQNERDFTFTLNKDLVKMNSATFEATGGKITVIKGDSIVQTDGTKTNTATASGNTVANGTKSTETTADGQVIKDGAKSNKSTVSSNVIDDGTGNVNTSNATSNTVTDGTNTTATTSSSVTVKDNAGNSTVITKDNITTGVGGNKITFDGTAGKATVGASIVDGVNNTFTTGGANAVKLDGVAGTIKTGTVTVTGGTTNDITGLSNTTVTGADFATKGRAATEEQLKAVGEQTWQITADKDATTSGAQTGTKKDAKVGKDDKVQLIAGENMTVNQNERDFTFTLNKDLVKMNSATFEVTGGKTTVIKGDSIVQTDGTKTNTATASGNAVANGTKSTETTAAGQVIKDGAKTNTSTVDENTIVDGTKSNKSTVDGNTITDGTNTTATTSSSVTVKDNAGNSTVITKDNITTGVGGNKITLDGTAGKATVGASVVDGVNNTFTTGGANAVKLDGVAGTIKTGTVTVTGGTTNDITGLSNTTVNSADFATKGRAATEEQLKAVGEQTWQITADKDATTSGAQTGTKKDAKVGKDDKVQLIAGENMTVNQNERDFTFTLNKDLVKMNSATFLGTGSNTTVITGNSITQTAGTQTNTSTAAGNTIANGTKSTETTADGQVIKDGAKSNKSTVDSNVIDDGNGNKNTSNATSNSITDGTNTSIITAGKANIGNIAVDGVNNKITMGNGATPVTLDGANGHLDGLTNTTWVPGVTKATTGRAATEDQLQQVSDAVGAGWKVNTGTVAGSSGVSNGAASTKVSSGEEVKLQAGDNLVIDQNGKTVSYSLNKDLTKMNSATFEATGGKTTVIKGDSIVQTDGGKTNTSNAAGNTVVDGNKSTATTAAGTTITDGAKTNTSTADKNVIDDGAGNTNVSNATSNTLKNAAGDETKADAKGVTVKDAAGNNATFTKDGITITKTGKDTVSLTSNGLDNGKNKIVNVAAGVANTDAVNVGQLKEYAAKSTTELTANGGQPAGSTTGNIVLTKTTAADGHTIYDNKLNDKITLGTDPTKAVTVDGTTGTVTGLTNKTWTPGSIVSGRAATEDQLKEAVADSGWKAAVDKEGSGQSTVVGTSPEKIKAEETVTFKAGNNMMVTQTGKSISYAVNPELTNMTSATFKDAAGNTTVTNGNGITITPGSANPTNPHAGPVSLTKDGLNNGNNQVKGVAPGTDPTDAVNVSQLNTSNANTSQAINQIAGEVQHVGAHAAAMAALKPIQYDPLEPTQVMAGVGNYRGETAAALGLAHYTNENTMFNVGVSVGGNHNMVNAGVTHKFGYSPEKKNIPDRYKAGPISSVYVMQDEVSSLKKENAEQKYVIADQAARLTTLEAENEQQRRELAETKKGLDDLKAAVDKLLASKG
ncbi:ESPR-type extended signal peptide-containing protein [Veillonella atypica]|uniref:YadA-like family protein n=1 Tax=Veillonella atypica TaxID=39777 RepID=UPI00352FD11B